MSLNRTPKAVILQGDGILSEFETAQAFATAGFQTSIQNIKKLKSVLSEFGSLHLYTDVIVIPDGYLERSALSPGMLVALAIKHELRWDLPDFLSKGGLILGIGTGFQAMIELEIFGKDLSLISNQSGKRIQQWGRFVPNGQHCVWLKGLGSMDLPIKTIEGRLVYSPEKKVETQVRMARRGMDCLKFEQNLTGSEDHLAGLCDITGRALGLIPHPELFLRWTSSPEWGMAPQRASAPGQGLALFENAYREVVRRFESN